MLHPFMPFITSEIYATLNPDAPQLSIETWPVAENWSDDEAMREFGFVKSAISSVRSLRAELNLSPAQPVTVSINGDGLEAVTANLETFTALARAELGEISGKTIADITPGLEVRVGFEGLVDESDWVEKAKKRAVEFEKQISQAQGKLSNEGFVARAPAEVIEEEKRRVEDFGLQLERLKAVLAQF
jgi:valyl-tRNA synthetase